MAEHPVSEPEEWRPVPGHPGYEASSLGHVRSVDRCAMRASGAFLTTISKHFGIAVSHAHRITGKESWKHLP